VLGHSIRVWYLPDWLDADGSIHCMIAPPADVADALRSMAIEARALRHVPRSAE